MKYPLFWVAYMTGVWNTPKAIEWSMNTHVDMLTGVCIYLGAAAVFGVAAFGMWAYLRMQHVL